MIRESRQLGDDNTAEGQAENRCVVVWVLQSEGIVELKRGMGFFACGFRTESDLGPQRERGNHGAQGPLGTVTEANSTPRNWHLVAFPDLAALPWSLRAG